MFGNLGEAASLAGANFRNFRKRYVVHPKSETVK